MQSKLLRQDAGERTYVLVLDAGEEAFAAITDFAADSELTSASVTALGGFTRVTIGWFDLVMQTYRPIAINRQCAGLSLVGDIVPGEGQARLHLHAVLGLSDGTTRGGHFLEGIVRPTLTVTIVEGPGLPRPRQRPDLGLARLDPS